MRRRSSHGYVDDLLELPVLRQLAGNHLIRSAADELAAEARAAPVAVSVAVALLALFLLRGPSANSSSREKAPPPSTKRAPSRADDDVGQLLQRLGSPDELHVEGTMIPCNGLIVGNRITEYENEMCHGKLLDILRAVHDKELDRSGQWPFGSYFHGKKRIWECRVQLRFKGQPPDPKDMYFGIELEKYVPMNYATKKAMASIVSMLKSVVGNQVYHTPGDDPKACQEDEQELPAFVMPLWAFDQYIVTAPGERPPDLDDESIPELGSKRVKRIPEFRRELDELVFETGATYTFCFWGISQWLDKLQWKVKVPVFGSLDFDQFCGRPPVHVVIYTLDQDGSKRHVQSRKRYFLNLAFWSSSRRPPDERVTDLLANADSFEGPSGQGLSRGANSQSRRGRAASSGRGSPGWLGCCAGR